MHDRPRQAFTDRWSTTARRRLAAVAALVLLGGAACSSSGSSGVAPSTVGGTVATTVATTTTAVPTTPAPTTTMPAPTTTLPAGWVSFTTSSVDEQPIVMADHRASATVTHEQVEGDLRGTMTEATLTVRWSDFGLGWFEGTAAGCGTGGMVLRFGVRPDGASGWEIVQGLGTGDLKAVTGHGVETSSGFQGTVDCDQPLGPVSLSTTLLEPTPSTGTLTGTPAHQQLGFTTYEVTPMAGQTNTPRLFVVESPMDIGYLFQVYAWWRDAAGEMRRDDCTPGLCNTGMFWWFLPPVCEGGGEAAVRAIIDDVELPPFSLGWDVPATLNGGAHGGGRGDGRVVCP